MPWPNLRDLVRDVPEALRVRPIARADVPTMIATLEAWEPHLRLLDPDLLTPKLYDEQAAFDGENAEMEQRPVLALAFEGAEGPLAYLVLLYELRDFLVCEFGEGSLAVRLSIVHPKHRGRGLESSLVDATLRIAQATSLVSLLYAFTALDDREACATLERAGFRLSGIMPSGGLRPLGQLLQHVPQAIWVKLLVQPEQLHWPSPENMRPRTAALLHLLYNPHETIASVDAPTVPLPNIDPVIAANIAARPGGRDTWPDISVLATSLALPPGIVVRPLARAELSKVLDMLPVWYPQILQSTIEYLTPATYNRVALAGEDARVTHRPGFAFVVEVEGEIALFSLYSFQTSRFRRLKGEFVVINPQHRRKNLSILLAPLWVLVARALESDTILGWATLAQPYTQLACERQGLDLVAIMPTERELDAQGVTNVVFEALYAAFLMPKERCSCPPGSAMPAHVAKVARFLLGERTAMHWLHPNTLALALALPEGMRVRKLGHGDVPNMIASIAAWEPGLATADPGLLDPDGYHGWTALLGETSAVAERPMLVLVFERGGVDVAYLMLAYEKRGHALLIRAMAVHPEHRGGELSQCLLLATTLIGQAMGDVDTIHALTELDDRQASADLERAGFQLWGLFPNASRRRVEGELRFTDSAMWAKMLVQPEEVLWPERAALLPRTAALLNRLFGRGEPDEGELDGAKDNRESLPTLEPAIAAQLAARPGGLDTWPDIGVLAGTHGLPEGVIVRRLARSDMAWISATLPVWYPDLADAMLNFILTPEFYEHAAALEGEESRVDERPYLAFVIEADGAPRAFGLCSFDTIRARMLRAELGVVDPHYRGRSLANHITTLCVLIARALAAETFLTWPTLVHPYAQLCCERKGINLAGITPASERFVAASGGVKRAFEAFYAVSLLPGDRRAMPPLDAMPERVASLVRFVHSLPEEQAFVTKADKPR